MKKNPNLKIFRHGANWLRADFHLHTRADNEFVYTEDVNFFAKAYFEQLEQEEIKIAVITNHNKFDLTEFRELRKWAERKEVYLLPGVEFSIKDGGKGLHILIAFDDPWIYNTEKNNYIQDFITSAFIGQTGYDRPPYQNSNFTFSETCKQLDKFDKDYFIIMAHVDDSSGLFRELNGRGLKDFVEADCFKNRVLAFQKSRTLKNLEMAPPIALVEGSDSAHLGIKGIGKGSLEGEITQRTYLKLSAYNFSALKFALHAHPKRVNKTLPFHKRFWIKNLIINPDTEEVVNLPFNSELNNLIGIRGGGKSSVLEAIRFGLDLPLPEDSERREDRRYKEEIVRRLLGNGGLLRLELADGTGQTVNFIERRIGNHRPEVFDDNLNPIPDKYPSDFLRVSYFGQKDLEYTGQNFNGQFIEEKLLTRQLAPFKNETEQVKKEILSTWRTICNLREDIDTLEDVNSEVKRLKRLQTNFEKYNLKDRLELITLYDAEEDNLSQIKETMKLMSAEFRTQLHSYIEELQQWLRHDPKVEHSLFQERIFPEAQRILEILDAWNEKINTPEEMPENLLSGFISSVNAFNERRLAQQQEFEKLKQQISNPDINVESFRQVERQLRVNLQKQQVLQKKEIEYEKLLQKLDTQLTNIHECWEAEFKVIHHALEKFNATLPTIQITATFLGDKNALNNKVKEWAKGSTLREEHYEQISIKYNSGIQLYRDLENDESQLFNILRGGSLLPKFQEKLLDCEDDLLTWRTPDYFEFLYNNRPLTEYSLGQRATALTAFILAHQDRELFLIDQPEDDLDNQTVASDLINQVLQTKSDTQYIFATHNPNIVVLGDSDQIIECQFSDGHFDLGKIGGIDDNGVQESVINIMEGGKEAIEIRTKFYQITNSWKH